MSGSEQHDRVALVSADDQAIMRGINNKNLLEINFGERQTLLEEAEEVLRVVVQCTDPTAMVDRVCDHPATITALQTQITYLQSQQVLPAECDHSTFEQQLGTLTQALVEARRTPGTVGTDENLRKELDEMTQDATQSGEEV